MENNALKWFRENFNDKRLESELSEMLNPSNTLRVRDEDIVNILKIFNDNMKGYNQEKKIEVTNDNTPCKNWNRPNSNEWTNGWACKIFCMHPSNCDGINCKENCDWYNHTGFFADDKKRTSKRKK
jgi:hypothetical protein